MLRIRFLLIALAAQMVIHLVAATVIYAQFGSFGRNKIHYREFQWRVLQGDRVDVYFYPDAEQIARMALSYAEESYRVLSHRLRHEVDGRIPLIIYASHTDFEQTNILPFVPPEGILGVTEFMKRRVAIPFKGSYSEFRHTLRHELVHVFQLSLFEKQALLYPRGKKASVPLWWSEGLAEYLSSDQDARDEMVVRDLTVKGRMPTIAQLGRTSSPVVYPVGGDLHRFLAAKYGEWRIALVYESLSGRDNFTDALQVAYGRSVEELTSEWHFDLRRRFFPEAADDRPMSLSGRLVAVSALKPLPLRGEDGQLDVLYLSAHSGYTNIYRVSASGKSKPEVVVAGERDPDFENLHPYSSRLDVRDGVLLFTTKYHERDALVFWDLHAGRVAGRYQFDSLVSILSPAFSPDGGRVVFSALTESAQSDLYMLDMADGELMRLTDDAYQDVDPDWLPCGRSVIFSSDRTAGGDEGAKNLFRLDVATGVIQPITSGPWVDEAPRWDPDREKVVFVSDRAGRFDVYEVDTLGTGRRLTRLEGAALDVAPIPGSQRLLVAAYADMSWSAYIVRPDSAAEGETFTLDSTAVATHWEWQELSDTSSMRIASARYQRTFALDFAAGAADMGGNMTASQGGQLFVSDMLGDHAIMASVALRGARNLGDLLDNLNGNIFYLNRSQRLNWGVGAFRTSGTFYGLGFRELYRETAGGIYGTLRYPLSRYLRVEGSTRLEYSNRTDFTRASGDLQQRAGFLSANYVSLVGDNALWMPIGPIDGRRWNVTTGVVSDLSNGVFENWMASLDYRQYVRTSQQSAVAVRAFGYVSEGTRPRAVHLGGSWMLRGYPYFSTDGTRAWLFNSEWRFPVAHFVTLGFPFGPVRLPQLQGALFADAAQAWYSGEYDGRVLGSAGFGLRTQIAPGVVLRLDTGRRFLISGPPDESGFHSRRFMDFFFGHNF